MTKNTDKIRMKFLTNSWVITLSATLIGVFAALYLTEIVASKKMENQKLIATKNLLAEISSNSEKIEKALKKHIEFVDIIVFMDNYSDLENGGLIVHADSIKKFRLKYPSVIVTNDSVQIDNGIYRYPHGELNFEFSAPQFEITTIAWKTLKSSGISPSYDFECLMYLEGLYNITNKVSEKNEALLEEALLEFLMTETRTKESNQKFIGYLQLLIDYEESLMKMYDSSEKELKNCS